MVNLSSINDGYFFESKRGTGFGNGSGFDLLASSGGDGLG